MKILLVNKFHYRKGGSETYYFDVADGLRQMGHDVIFFAMESPENEPCEQSEYFVSAKDYNGKTSVVQKIKAATSLVYSKEAKEKFEKLLQIERPDVIHLNLVHRQITFSILDAPSAKGIPVVYTAHDYVPICPNCIMLDNTGSVCEECLNGSFMPCFRKKCVKNSTAKSALAVMEANYLRRHHAYSKIDRVIAPSDFMRKKLIEGGFPDEQVVTMQNFIDSSLMLGAAVDEVPTLPVKEPYFLYFGRLSKEKGVDLLVKAFLEIEESLPPEWSLVIVGDGPERDAIEEMLPEGNSRIFMAGYQSGAMLRAYVERASLAIVSSRWRENMPYSIIEAFAAGTPVIGAQIGGIPELVIEEETGFLFELGEAGSLAQVMLRSANVSTEDYRKMQSKCAKYIYERCSRRLYTEALVDIYAGLVSE